METPTRVHCLDARTAARSRGLVFMARSLGRVMITQ
jgi:hypothetical protein